MLLNIFTLAMLVLIGLEVGFDCAQPSIAPWAEQSRNPHPEFPIRVLVAKVILAWQCIARQRYWLLLKTNKCKMIGVI